MSEPRNVRWLIRDRRRRRRLTAFVVVLALVVAAPLLLDGLRVEVGPLETVRSRVFGEFQQIASSQNSDGDTGGVEEAGSAGKEAGDGEGKGGQPRNGEEASTSSDPSPTQPSPASASYAAVAPALPGVEPASVGGTFQSTEDPSWAVTEIEAPSRDGSYTVYSEKVEGGWEASRSVLANNPDYPRKGRSPLVGLPGDLRDALYPETAPEPAGSPEAAARDLVADGPYLGEGWRPVSLQRDSDSARVRLEKEGSEDHTYAYLRLADGSWSAAGLGRSLTAAELPDFPGELVESGSLPDAGPAMVPTTEPVLEDIPRDRRGKVEDGLGEARETVEDYEGTVGLYVQGSGEDWGYGIRPDERFYTASVIKVPVMAAVYRKVESGELSLSETVATEDRDYAGGAGSLQWQEESVSHSVEDYLWMMITESDNVATNALVRSVGGPEYVNEVAGDLGAEETALRQKVTDQRAAAPGLDNYTTPRDMATILDSIASGEAADEAHTEAMLGLMQQNDSDSWLGLGLPPETETACKVGWIGGVYNEVCLVQSGEEPYIISVFSKYGPTAVGEGASTLEELSAKVWEIQENGGEEPEEEEEEEG